MKKIIIIIIVLAAGYALVSQKCAEKTIAETEKRETYILKREKERMDDMRGMDKVMQQNVTDRMKSVDENAE